jgi:hypothetical protein
VETSIELRYAGVVIGRVTVAGDIDESSLFLPIPDPLPVGTKVSLKLDDRAVEGRVIGVSESSEPSKCGMKVQIGGAGSAAPAAVAAPAAPSPVPSPVPSSVPSSTPSAEMAAEGSGAHADGPGDGVPNAEDSAGPSGGTGGRRKKRRR